MSYVKETIGSTKLIRFYHKTDDIFDEASEITAFKASAVRKADGKADFSAVQISADEKEHLKKYIGKGILEIYGDLFKILGSDANDNPLFINEDITVAAATFEASGGFVIDNEKYRELNLALLESKIFDALVDYVLYRWYLIKNMGDDSGICLGRFKETLIEIIDLSLALRLP